jgi:NADH-quinone oxidoreductase subunit A
MQAVLYLEYAPIFVFIVFAFALALIIFGLSYALAINAGDPEKLSPYECGFEPFDDARNTFDIRFYLVAILFILFDLEATFLFPWATTLSNLTNLGFWSMFDFIFELVIGFIYAWKIGSLEWE